jgi:hypothetical protein
MLTLSIYELHLKIIDKKSNASITSALIISITCIRIDDIIVTLQVRTHNELPPRGERRHSIPCPAFQRGNDR